jgi:hypothetical protein
MAIQKKILCVLIYRCLFSLYHLVVGGYSTQNNEAFITYTLHHHIQTLPRIEPRSLKPVA